MGLGRSDSLKPAQPAEFGAEWDSRRLTVQSVVFDVNPKGETGWPRPIALDIDQASGQGRVTKSPDILNWLRHGTTCEVGVRVTLAPPTKGKEPVEVRLAGEPFNVREPWPIVGQTDFGGSADLVCRPLERFALPIRQWFKDLNPDNACHRPVVTAFGNSAGLKVHWKKLPDRDWSWEPGSLSWLACPADPSSYCLGTAATFTPLAASPATVMLEFKFPQENGQGHALMDRPGRLDVQKPRIAATVSRLAPDGRVAEILFDSNKWLGGRGWRHSPHGAVVRHAHSGGLGASRRRERATGDPLAVGRVL